MRKLKNLFGKIGSNTFIAAFPLMFLLVVGRVLIKKGAMYLNEKMTAETLFADPGPVRKRGSHCVPGLF